VSNEIEQRVKTAFPFVESLMIHMEPQQEDSLRIAIPVVDDQGLASKTTGHFGEAPYFLFIDVEQSTIQQWTTIQNPSLELKKRRGITIATLLLEEETTTVLANRVGEGPFHYLRDSFIELYQIAEDIPVSQALTQLLDGQLPSIQSATIGAKQEGTE
jgi:predicted Fe-Mo cluster-binding NifX family protein